MRALQRRKPLLAVPPNHLIRPRQPIRGIADPFWIFVCGADCSVIGSLCPPDIVTIAECYADLLRCLKINDKLELRWLLDRQIGGFSSVQDSVHIISDAPEAFVLVGPVGQEPAATDKFLLL